jgi:hypothetical protein
MMRALDRYVGALMIFTFGFAILAICGIWLKRGNFVLTVQDSSQLVSAAQTPKGFFGYIIPSLVLGVLLVTFSVYVILRVSRAPDPDRFQPVGSPIAIRATGLFLLVLIIILAVQFFRA